MADLIKRTPWWERLRITILVAIFTVIEWPIHRARRRRNRRR